MQDALDGIADPGSVDPKIAPLELDKGELQRKWSAEIGRYERKAQQFEKRGKRIIERYTAEKKDENAKTTTFNVLWSNIQTLKPALYAKDPTPEIERRFKDDDPIGKTASEVLERCCINVLSQQNFGEAVRQAVLDRLLPGRGVLWVRYLPHFRKVSGQVPSTEDQGASADKPNLPNTRVEGDKETGTERDGAELSSDEPEDIEEVDSEEVKFDFVPWTDFGHTVARTWEECDAVWRCAYLDRHEVRKRFTQEIAAQLPYDQKPEGLDKDAEGADLLNKTKIYEIWDKRTKRVIRLHRSHPEVLEVQDDPLELDGFWPIPMPLQATTSSVSIIPTADYILWQDQAKELDRLSHRIAMLTRAVKAIGVYDSSVQALQQLLNTGNENTLVPVDSWAAFAEKGGLKGAVELLDVSMVAEVLLKLYEARDKVKADIYEISGMSDLIRGASDPEETATAQKIKSNYASVRLKDMQREVQVFARDSIRIAAEIVCGQFALDSIKELSGVHLLTNAEKAALKVQVQHLKIYQQHAQQIVQQHQQAAQEVQQLHAQQPQPGLQPGQTPPVPPFDPATVLGPPPPPPNPAQMALMGQPSWEDVHALLQARPARNFRIDIETDSTILQDERQEQESRMEFAKTVNELIQGAMQVVQEVPQLSKGIAETIMLVLRSFKVGRSTESAFQEAMDQLAEMGQNPKPKPNPEMIKVQGEQQLQQARLQGDMQLQQAKVASEEKLEQFRVQMQQQADQAKAAAEERREQQQMALEQQRAAAEQAWKEREAAAQRAFDEWKVRIEQETKVIVAQISAKSASDTATIKASADHAIAQTQAAAQVQGAAHQASADVASARATADAAASQDNSTGAAVADAVEKFTEAISGLNEQE